MRSLVIQCLHYQLVSSPSSQRDPRKNTSFGCLESQHAQPCFPVFCQVMSPNTRAPDVARTKPTCTVFRAVCNTPRKFAPKIDIFFLDVVGFPGAAVCHMHTEDGQRVWIEWKGPSRKSPVLHETPIIAEDVNTLNLTQWYRPLTPVA